MILDEILTDVACQEQIQKFFDSELTGIGYTDNLKSRSLYPRLNHQLQDQAISKNFMFYDDKDKLIRDPNKLSIFFIKFRSESPFTKQSLNQLGLQDSDCDTILFEDFYKQQQNPLESLVRYMQYMTERYRLLQQILHTRNKIKNDSKRLKKLIQIQSPMFQNTAFLTNGLEITNQAKQNYQNSLSHSFHHKTLDITHEEKVRMYKQRNEGFEKTYLRQITNSEKQQKDIEDFYEIHKPLNEAKIQRVQDENRIKFELRLKKRSDKQAKTLQKIKIMQDKNLEIRQRVNEEIDDKQTQNQENRKRLESDNRQQQKENQQEEEYLYLKREQKRLLAIQLEEEQIQNIMDINQFKDQRSKDHIETLKYNYTQKKELRLQTYLKVKERVEQSAIEYQSERFNTFMNHQLVVQDQLLGQKKNKELLQQMRQKRTITLQNKITINKVKQEEKQLNRMEAIKEKEDEKLCKLRTVQSNTEIRAQDYMAKNKERVERVLIQCNYKQKLQETQSLRMIDKLRGNSERVKLIKKEQEELKSIGFQQHIEFNKVLESISAKRKTLKT